MYSYLSAIVSIIAIRLFTFIFTAPQFGVFNRLVNENDGSAMVCVEFIADTAITVESTLTTMSYTAIGKKRFILYFLTMTVLSPPPPPPPLDLSLSHMHKF